MLHWVSHEKRKEMWWWGTQKQKQKKTSKRRELSTRRAGFEQRSVKLRQTPLPEALLRPALSFSAFGCKASTGFSQLGCHSLTMIHEPIVLLLRSPSWCHPLISRLQEVTLLSSSLCKRSSTAIWQYDILQGIFLASLWKQVCNLLFNCTRMQFPLELEKSCGKAPKSREGASQELLDLREVQSI